VPPPTEVGSSLLYRDDWSLGWQPSVDQRHGARNLMLRADNLRLDERGVPSLRLGSTIISGPTALGAAPVRVLYTTTINTVRYRFAQVGGVMYRSQSVGSYISIASVASDKDVAITAQLGQVFFGSGTTKWKNDGVATREWGIGATPATPSISTTEGSENPLSTFDVTETPLWVASEGTVESGTGKSDEPDGARVLIPNADTGRGSMQRVLGAETDYFTFPNGEGGAAEDLISFYVWLSNPDNLELVTLAFDCNGDDLSSAAARFRDDYYYHDFAFEDAVEVTLAKGGQYLDDRYDVQGYERDDVIDRREDRVPYRGVRIPRRQPQEADNSGWAKFLVPRARFERVGNTPGKSWSTVVAVSVTVKYRMDTARDFPGVVKVDDLRIIGGAEHTLSGRFRARVQFYADYGTHLVRSAASAFSDEVECRGNGLRVSVPVDAAFDQHVRGLAGDPTCGVEAYVMGGSMNGFYLGGSKEQHSGTVTVECTQSERDMLIVNVPLVADNFPPPDNMVAAADHHNRVFVLDLHELRGSARFNPESYPLKFTFPVGNASFRPLWLAASGDDLFVGTTIDIFALEGHGDEMPDGTTDFRLRRLGLAEPPISEAVASEGGRLCYLASDGPRVLVSQGSIPLKANLDLLYAGEARYGIAAPNLGSQPGRFRFAMWGATLYAIVPEGDSGDGSPVIHVHDFKTETWRRTKYPFDLWTVYREPDGKINAGSGTGTVHQLDVGGTHTDQVLGGGLVSAIVEQGITFVKFYTKYDDDGQPLKHKVPFDIRVDGDFDADLQVVLYSDGITVPDGVVGDFVEDPSAVGGAFAAFTIPANSDMPYIARINGNPGGNTALPDPKSLQFRIGTIDSPATYITTFRLRSFGITYRLRPTPRVYWDSGFLDSKRDEVWFRRIFLKMRPGSGTVVVKVVFESGALHTLGVTLTPGTEDIYEARLGRFIRGRLPRIVIGNVDGDSTPFELYWVEVWTHGTGVATEKRKLQVA
jgi:hypothetical protein